MRFAQAACGVESALQQTISYGREPGNGRLPHGWGQLALIGGHHARNEPVRQGNAYENDSQTVCAQGWEFPPVKGHVVACQQLALVLPV